MTLVSCQNYLRIKKIIKISGHTKKVSGCCVTAFHVASPLGRVKRFLAASNTIYSVAVVVQVEV